MYENIIIFCMYVLDTFVNISVILFQEKEVWERIKDEGRCPEINRNKRKTVTEPEGLLTVDLGTLGWKIKRWQQRRKTCQKTRDKNNAKAS